MKVTKGAGVNLQRGLVAKFKRMVLFSAAFAAIASQVQAQTTINFDTLSPGTPVTTQFSSQGLSFSLIDSTDNIEGGLNATYTPEIGNGSFDSPTIGISNSPTGNYPTADILQFQFTSPATVDSFFFNNYGDNELSTWTAFNSVGTEIGSGNLGSGGEDTGLTVTPDLAGVSKLQFSNGEPSGSWEYVVGSVTYSESVAAPEPSTWVMLVGGVVSLLFLARRRQKAAVV